MMNQHAFSRVSRAAFHAARVKAGELTGWVSSLPSKTQQNFRDEVDINTIVRRFGLTGKLPDVVRMPQYVDYEGVFDFQSAMNTVLQAEASFMSVPAEIRARFGNDPQRFLEFVSDPASADELVKLGLRVAPPSPAPAPPAPSPAPLDGA